MHVELLTHTPNPEQTCAAAARLCYSPSSAGDLREAMSEEDVYKVLGTVLGNGHHSTLEHASYTFAVEGISRTTTHQLVRHRLASFSQQSQRYVAYEDGIESIMPHTIAENDRAASIFEKAMEDSNDAYQLLLGYGVPPEDARYVLPNAAETKIVITMNIRELLHFFSLRCCNRAQWEIREMAHEMLELVRPTAPFIFADAGAPCVRSTCPEGKMCCGNPYPKVGR